MGHPKGGCSLQGARPQLQQPMEGDVETYKMSTLLDRNKSNSSQSYSTALSDVSFGPPVPARCEHDEKRELPLTAYHTRATHPPKSSSLGLAAVRRALIARRSSADARPRRRSCECRRRNKAEAVQRKSKTRLSVCLPACLPAWLSVCLACLLAASRESTCRSPPTACAQLSPRLSQVPSVLLFPRLCVRRFLMFLVTRSRTWSM